MALPPSQYPAPNFFKEDPNNTWGQAINGALSQGLDVLTKHKMQQITEQKKRAEKSQRATELAAIKDTNNKSLFTPEESVFLANADPKLAQLFMQHKLGNVSSSDYNDALDLLQGGSPSRNVQANRSVQEDSAIQKSIGHQMGNEIFGRAAGSPEQEIQKALYGGPKGLTNLPPFLGRGEQTQQPIIPEESKAASSSKPAIEAPEPLFPSIPKELLKKLTPDQRQKILNMQKDIRKEHLEQQKFKEVQSSKAQKFADEQTAPFYNEKIAQHSSNKEMRWNLDRLSELLDDPSGLPSGLMYKILKDLDDSSSSGGGAALGGILGGLGGIASGEPGAAKLFGAAGSGLGAVVKPFVTMMRYWQKGSYPNIDEFEKITSSFIKGAKSVFGSRVTDKDLEYFMATIPTLANTEVGRRAIIRNMQNIIEASNVEYKEMVKIMEENGGHRPLDIALRVEKHSEPKLNKLAADFKKGIRSASIH